MAEVRRAVAAGYAALEAFNSTVRRRGREILEWCARSDRPCILILARPYHMDPGIGHEIEADLQAYGYPILWGQYLPTDPDLMDWLFGEDVRTGLIGSRLPVMRFYARRYALFTLVGIAGEEDVDAPDLVTPQQTSGPEKSKGNGSLNGGQLHAPRPAAGRRQLSGAESAGNKSVLTHSCSKLGRAALLFSRNKGQDRAPPAGLSCGA